MKSPISRKSGRLSLNTHTMEELFVGAQTRGVRLMPVNNVKNVVEDIGLKERSTLLT